EKASQVGRAAAMIGAGAVILMPALVLLLFALSAALIRGGFSEPAAYLLKGPRILSDVPASTALRVGPAMLLKPPARRLGPAPIPSASKSHQQKTRGQTAAPTPPKTRPPSAGVIPAPL